ncbi:hypothetical protein [Mycobacterium sp. ITM-2016-00318]|uniref:hypothetical protein n=1 Tax=Mycobacterium sp. ITM-2016-00318 TaxID=2099693 RepID=UPI00287FD621|nr:hypothetical protein [Mycobacterium sp. ITM-2016-00318]WNG90758.1 hypothetical protein C6A82_014480 [Mycobacterium sp. ITM-2016-00318]
MRAITLTFAALIVLTGCTAERVVNTGEWATDTSSTAAQAAPAAPPLPPTNPALLANGRDFAQNTAGRSAYYFSTPSGRWQCAILPGDMAGCGGTTDALAITGAPETVPDADGQQTPPNAIVVGPQGDARFAAVDAAAFAPPSPATVLPFNRTLAVARFRCNLQESKGVSCLSEASGKGFTFSADGFDLHYSEVPLDAP